MDRCLDININLIEINIDAKNKEQLLEILVKKLEKEKCVDSNFLVKVLEREKVFPTGLKFEKIGVAIPHANPENVYKSSIAFGICKNTVVFNNMENSEQQVDVKAVVVLAVNNSDMHLSILNKLICIFQDNDKVRNILSLKDKNDLYLSIKKYLDL